MEKLDQLVADLKAVDERIDTLLSGESLSDDERAEYDRLVAKRSGLVDDIKRETDRVAREQERARIEAEREERRQVEEERQKLADERKRLAEERARRSAPVSRRLTDPDGPPQDPADRAQHRPAETVPATVKRSHLKHFKGTKHGREAEYRAYRFGQWALSRLSQDIPNRFQFRSATDWVRKHMAAVLEQDGSGYQYWIPEEFGTDLIDLREKFGVTRRLFKIVPMNSDTRVDPRRSGGLTAYFMTEGQPGTESNKVWTEVRLTAKDLMVLSRYTAQINADSVINVGDDLAGEIAYAFSKKEDDCAFNGDGTSTYGGIVGVRSALTTGTKAGLKTAGTTGSWGALVLSDFHAVVGLLPQFADTPDCSWVCHRTFYYTVMQKLELASGGVPAREVQLGGGDGMPTGVMGRGRPLFLGYPVEFSQIMPSATAASQVPVVLGNYVQGASFGDRQMDSIAFSEHASVGGENVFERNQIAIRGTERMDINVHDVGDANNPGPIVGLTT